MDQSAISIQASQRVTTAPAQFYGGAGLAAEQNFIDNDHLAATHYVATR